MPQERDLMKLMDWMQVCSADEFVREGYIRMTPVSPTVLRDALQIFIDRVKNEVVPSGRDAGPLAVAYEYVFGNPDVFEAIGRAEDHAKAAAHISKNWKGV